MTEDERFAEIAAGIHTAILAAGDTPTAHADIPELIRHLHNLLDGYVSRLDSERDQGGALVRLYMQRRQAGMLKPEFVPKQS
jgi:hypothetical protein